MPRRLSSGPAQILPGQQKKAPPSGANPRIRWLSPQRQGGVPVSPCLTRMATTAAAWLFSNSRARWARAPLPLIALGIFAGVARVDGGRLDRWLRGFIGRPCRFGRFGGGRVRCGDVHAADLEDRNASRGSKTHAERSMPGRRFPKGVCRQMHPEKRIPQDRLRGDTDGTGWERDLLIRR